MTWLFTVHLSAIQVEVVGVSFNLLVLSSLWLLVGTFQVYAAVI